jgi:hypothetical protein
MNSVKTSFYTMIGACLVSFAAMPAQAMQGCSDQTLQGSFGYTVSGSITASTGPFAAGEFAAVGRITFDGRGHVATVRTLSDNGLVLQDDAGTGTYSVNPDCTGSFNITVGPPGNAAVLNLNLVLDGTREFREIRAIVTNANFVLLLQGRRQDLSPVSE